MGERGDQSRTGSREVGWANIQSRCPVFGCWVMSVGYRPLKGHMLVGWRLQRLEKSAIQLSGCSSCISG